MKTTAKRPLLTTLAACAALLSGCSGGPGTTGEASATEAESEGTTGTTGGPSTGTGTGSESEGSTGDEPLPPAEIPDGCNPIAYANDCLLPYPSDIFLVPDGELPNGARVVLTPAATPKTAADVPVDMLQTHPADGFPGHMPILALFPEGVDTQGLNFHLAGGDATLDPASPTLVVDAESGALIPHWVELDVMADDPAEQALILRTFAPLEASRRYVVALRGLTTPMGAPIDAPSGFAHIVAGEVEGHPVLEPLAARYEDEIFPVLDELGVDRDGLQLAWDFSVASEERNTRDLLTIRDHVIATFEGTPPTVMIDAEHLDYSDEIALRLEGRIEVPLYLEEDAPMARLHRDNDGEVVANGTHWIDFTLQVPKSAFPESEDFVPARIIQFGHGFFGEREEINWSAMRGFSAERGLVMIATDWVGMSVKDQAGVVDFMSKDPSNVFLFTDRLHQAFANQIALTYAIQGPLLKATAEYAFGKPLYDPDQLYWYGISQGSIFGATFLSLSPTIERGVLSVGGGPYSLMMTRSGSFADLFEIIKLTITDDPLTIQKFVAMSQHVWDRVDPVTYAGRLLADPYPGSPERRVLFQYGLHDHSVNNLASHVLLRGSGIPLLEPAVEAVYGVDGVSPPIDGSAATAIDIHVPEPYPGTYAELPDEPADEYNAHEAVRRNAKMREQIDMFLRPGGLIDNYCDGVCDPE